jgi:hypothetical protein
MKRNALRCALNPKTHMYVCFVGGWCNEQRWYFSRISAWIFQCSVSLWVMYVGAKLCMCSSQLKFWCLTRRHGYHWYCSSGPLHQRVNDRGLSSICRYSCASCGHVLGRHWKFRMSRAFDQQQHKSGSSDPYASTDRVRLADKHQARTLPYISTHLCSSLLYHMQSHLYSGPSKIVRGT